MHNHRDTDRMEYYSDAVMAIAATLLATELPKPEGKTDLLPAIANQWPLYAAFSAPFLFICIAWANHYNRYRYIRQTDQYLLLLNIIFLLLITMQSFTTRLPAWHVGRPEERTAVLLYHATLVLTILPYNVVWRRVTKASGLPEEDSDPGQIRLPTIECAIAPALHLVAFLICLWSAPWSIVPIVLLSAYFALKGFSEKKQESKYGSACRCHKTITRDGIVQELIIEKEFSIL